MTGLTKANPTILTDYVQIRFGKWGKVFITFDLQVTPIRKRTFHRYSDINKPISSIFDKIVEFHEKMVQVESLLNTRTKETNGVNASSCSSTTTAKLGSMHKENTSHDQLRVQLYDTNEKIVCDETKNVNAWIENYVMRFNQLEYKVLVNWPYFKKIHLAPRLIAGMPAMIDCEIDVDFQLNGNDVDKFSKFAWYYSKLDYDSLKSHEPHELEHLAYMNRSGLNGNNKRLREPDTTREIHFDPDMYQHHEKKTIDIEWILFEEGVNKRACILNEITAGKLIKVCATPSDGKRDGKSVECVSSGSVEAKCDLSKFPMTKRHEMTPKKFPHNSNMMRVISYNLLAKIYCDRAFSKTQLYPYCHQKYLDFAYRRIFLIHEILNYNADVIFLQECDEEFFKKDLKSFMPDYQRHFKLKLNLTEGEAILFRSDRYKFVSSFDICLTNELKSNPSYKKIWSRITKTDSVHRVIKSKGTILQLVQVEINDRPGHHLLLANTHLFFNPDANFVRLMQAIVCVKHIETTRNKLLKNNPQIKSVDILFGGDFNSEPSSIPHSYLFHNKIELDRLSKECQIIVDDVADDLKHSFELKSHECLPCTQCQHEVKNIVDFIFYEQKAFELANVVPVPSFERMKENVALPSRFFPSDHLAVVFEFKRNSQSSF